MNPADWSAERAEELGNKVVYSVYVGDAVDSVDVGDVVGVVHVEED